MQKMVKCALCAEELIAPSGPDMPMRKQSAISGTAQIAVMFLNRWTGKRQCKLSVYRNS